MATLEQFIAQIERWKVNQMQGAAEVARGLSVAAFNHIVEISPQYSGDFAANWKYSIGKVDASFEAGIFDFKHGGERLVYSSHRRGEKLITRGFGVKDSARIAGDPEAINYAKSANAGRDSAFTIGATAYISNSAVHDEPYAWKIENGTIRFRKGNKGHVRAETIEHMMALYGGVLTPAKVTALQHTRIGV